MVIDRGLFGSQTGAAPAVLETLFTILITGQTLSHFPDGWIRDRYGPRLPLLVGTVLLASGSIGFAVATSAVEAGVAVAVEESGAGAAYMFALNTR